MGFKPAPTIPDFFALFAPFAVKLSESESSFYVTFVPFVVK